MRPLKTKNDFIKAFFLVGSYLERADLSGKDLSGVNFSNANLRRADLSKTNLRGAKFVKADLSCASLYQADCEGADFSGADMSMSYYKAASFKDARMCYCTLRNSMGKNALFFDTDLRGSDMLNAFLVGARFDGANIFNVRNLDRAILRLWVPPEGGKPSYDPVDGWILQEESWLGGVAFQENAGPGKVED